MKKLSSVLFLIVLLLTLPLTLYGCYLDDWTKPAENPAGNTEDEDEEETEEEDFVLPTPDPTQNKFMDLAYGSGKSQKLDILLPQKLENMEEDVPFFLFIHGGSWTSGDKTDIYLLSNMLDLYGYAAVSINYRLLGEGVNYLDMLNDITAAVSYIKKAAPAFKLKTDKMGMIGLSAGGHLALLYAFKSGETSKIPVSLLVSLVGPADFTDSAFYEAGVLSLTEKLSLMSALLGTAVGEDTVTSKNYPDALYDASPITHVKKNFPATVLAYGGKDWLVPPSNGQRLYDALRAHNSKKVRLVIYPNSGHELDKDADKQVETLTYLLGFAKDYLPSAIIN